MLAYAIEIYNPKICDFGFATFNEKNLKDFLGTLNYLAPELILRKPYDGFKADIFSLGVILLNLATCKIGFFEASKNDQFYRLIMTQHYKSLQGILKQTPRMSHDNSLANQDNANH